MGRPFAELAAVQSVKDQNFAALAKIFLNKDDCLSLAGLPDFFARKAPNLKKVGTKRAPDFFVPFYCIFG